jgi:transcriptional regulator with XRE-family HTH domain
MYKSDIFPKKLKEARKYRNLSQKDIADVLGIHVVSYGKYELGKLEINASLLPKIANLERLDVNYYFTDAMTLSEADLDNKGAEKVLDALSRKIEKLESKIRPINVSEDPLLRRIVDDKRIRELVEILQYFDESMLRRFVDVAFGFLHGERIANELLEKKTIQN